MRKPPIAVAAAIALLASGTALADLESDNMACYESARDSNPDLAILYCSRVIQSDKINEYDKSAALLNRGVAYRQAGNFEAAISDYTAVIELNGEDDVAYANRANAYRQAGDLAAARTDIDEALALNPDRAASYYVRGLIEEAAGQTTEAEADFRRANELAPDNDEFAEKLELIQEAP